MLILSFDVLHDRRTVDTGFKIQDVYIGSLAFSLKFKYLHIGCLIVTHVLLKATFFEDV